MAVAALSLRVIAVIVFGSLSAPNVAINRVTIPGIVNRWFSIAGIVNGWFSIPGIIGDSFITLRIVLCCCRLCRLDPWLLKRPRPCRLSFRRLLRRRGLVWRYLLSV
jgi:hypothetical protein